MPNFILNRDTRLFVSTVGVQTSQANYTTNCTTGNTFEVPVLSGYSFSQNTTSTTITVDEAGPAPTRGQQSFNDAIEAAEVSFSTYLRPYKYNDTTVKHFCNEAILWQAMFSTTGNIGGVSSGSTIGTGDVTFDLTQSNSHNLVKLTLFFVLNASDLANAVCYRIDDVQLNSATIDFALDQIGQIQWSGIGTRITKDDNFRDAFAAWYADNTAIAANVGAFYKDTVATKQVVAAPSSADFIKNKLSAITMVDTLNSNKAYTVALTGGSITIENGVQPLIPEELGRVNQSIGTFTGTRSITGTVRAYFKLGSAGTAELLADLTAALSRIRQQFEIDIKMGGATAPYVHFSMPKAHIGLPTISTEDVLSTEITFTAQGDDVDATNEMTLKYVGSTFIN